jgi:hypothetical protein
MWWKGKGKGGLIHFGAADIFTLISLLQLKANKIKEQICTSELEKLFQKHILILNKYVLRN